VSQTKPNGFAAEAGVETADAGRSTVQTDDPNRTADGQVETIEQRVRAVLDTSGLAVLYGKESVDGAFTHVGPAVEQMNERAAAEAVLEKLLGSTTYVRVLIKDLFAKDQAQTTPEADDEPETTQVVVSGKTIILSRLIGDGAFGRVSLEYEKDAPPDNRVQVKKTLKLKSSDPNKKVLKRFKQEVKILRKLGGVVTPQVTDDGETDGHPYYRMRYKPGYSLADVRKSAGLEAFPPGLVSTLGAELALRMHFVHQHGYKHRDFKPENVLLGDDGQLRVIDFGYAAEAHDYEPEQSRCTSVGDIVGTASYMAPEQIITPLAVDEKADVYSLGCTLYEMYTGRLPFIGQTTLELVRQHQDAACKPDFSLIKDPKVAKFIERMMDKSTKIEGGQLVFLTDNRPTMVEVAKFFWDISPLRERHPDFGVYMGLPLEDRSLFPDHARAEQDEAVETPIPSRFLTARNMFDDLVERFGHMPTETSSGSVIKVTRGRLAGVVGFFLLIGGVVYWQAGRSHSDVLPAAPGSDPVPVDVKKTPLSPEKKLPPAIPGLEVNERGYLQTVKLRGAKGELVLNHDEGVHVTAGSRRISFYHPDPARMETMLGTMPVLPDDTAKKYGLPAYVYADCGEVRSYVAFVGNVGFIFVDGAGKKHIYSANSELLETVGKDYDVTGSVSDFFENPAVQHFLEDYQLRGQMGIESGARMKDHLPPDFAKRDDAAWKRVFEIQLNAWKGAVIQKKQVNPN
jgi:serine/threonine protein kinase